MSRSFEPDSRGAELFGKRGNTTGMSDPSDKAGLDEGMQAGGHSISHIGLRRVWRDDFQIPVPAQRKQRVLCSAAGMHSAKPSANAGALFNKHDPGLQIGRAEQDMVKLRRKAHRQLSPQD